MGWALGVSAAAHAQALDQKAASALVSHVSEEAIAVLSAPGLSPEQRAHSLRDLIARYASSERLSENILGREWAHASDETRRRFESSLVRYITALCAEFANDVSPDTKIRVTDVKAKNKDAVVRSVVGVAGDDPATLDWLVARDADGRLVLADVSGGGVSLIQTIRADLRAVLLANAGNLDALIAAMNGRVKLAAD